MENTYAISFVHFVIKAKNKRITLISIKFFLRHETRFEGVTRAMTLHYTLF